MFEGIVRLIGIITHIKQQKAGIKVAISANLQPEGSPKPGDSIACAGACLTVTDTESPNLLWFDVSPETLDRTNFQFWELGQEINLEQPLRYGDPISGHLVQGHIDCTAKVKEIHQHQDNRVMTMEVPEATLHLIAPKGSVCLDGVSLTVNSATKRGFSVNIIPFTNSHTTFRNIEIGAVLNLEIDMMAKYLAHMNRNPPNALETSDS